jgi:hypothetical protein
LSFKDFLAEVNKSEYAQINDLFPQRMSLDRFYSFINWQYPFFKRNPSLSSDIEKSCQSIFKNKDKKYKKILLDFMVDTCAITKLKKASLIEVASRLIRSGINKDLVYNRIQLAVSENKVFFAIGSITFIRSLLKEYDEKRVIDLFFDEDTSGQEMEINSGLREFKDKLEKYTFKKKPKSLKEIHDDILNKLDIIELDRSQFETKNEPLNPREDLINLDNKIIECNNSKFLVKIAKSRHDLCVFSSRSVFNNCVGKFSEYFEKGKEGKSTFIGVFSENNKPLYCIEANKYNFIQASGVSNSLIPIDIRRSLESLLTLTPEVPSDFTPVKHSFIFGYKYNSENQSLFLMFSKNEMIYEYEDVDPLTYEEFVSEPKKGAFLNSVLKKKRFNKCS